MRRPVKAARIAARRDGPIATPIIARFAGWRSGAAAQRSLIRPWMSGPANQMTSRDLADRAGLAQRLVLLRRDEAVLQQRRALADGADADEGDVGLIDEREKAARRGQARQQFALLGRARETGSGIG